MPDMVLCAGCGKPIHIDDFGGAQGIDGQKFLFHDNVVCMMEVDILVEEIERNQAKPGVLSTEVTTLQTNK